MKNHLHKVLLCLLGIGIGIALCKFKDIRMLLTGTKRMCYSYDTHITHMKAIDVHGEKYPGFAPAISQAEAAAVENTYCPPCKRESCEPCQTHILEKDNRYQGIQVACDKWMKMACEEALLSVQNEGGPFGAVILQIDDETGNIIRYWRNHNHVPEWNDPTAHAEVSTIRAATKELGVVDLGKIHKKDAKLRQPGETSHCIIYSSAEPCPMCLSSIYWAGIKELTFSATIYDAAAKDVDFSDAMIYEELALPLAQRKHMQVRHASCNNALDAFNYYKRNKVITYGASK